MLPKNRQLLTTLQSEADKVCEELGLTYCKALPQISEQINALGVSEFEMFLFDYIDFIDYHKLKRAVSGKLSIVPLTPCGKD